jgi:hypothetical protein
MIPLSAQEVADATGLSASTIAKKIMDGTLKGEKVREEGPPVREKWYINMSKEDAIEALKGVRRINRTKRPENGKRDLYTVDNLAEELEVGRSTVYARLKALGCKAFYVGAVAYYTPDTLSKLRKEMESKRVKVVSATVHPKVVDDSRLARIEGMIKALSDKVDSLVALWVDSK